jgi:nitrogen regulatory protein P-II 1
LGAWDRGLSEHGLKVMTKIEAFIRTHLLQQVQDALEEIGLRGLTVSDVRGTGHSKAATHTFRGSQYGHTLNPRLKLEILVNDDQVDEAVGAIEKAAHTGEIGDGKIYTIPLGEVVRIRTGERGSSALS